MAKSYPWAEIKHAYVSTEATLAELANKYGPSESQLRKRAAAEKWTDERNKFRTETERKTTEKTVERISDERSEINARHYALWQMVIDKLERALMTALEVDEIETLTRALDRAHKGQRLAKEMDRKDEQPNAPIPDALAALANGGATQPTPFLPPASGADENPREP